MFTKTKTICRCSHRWNGPGVATGAGGVFGSGGFANPTYTIVQLALRLADHLAGEVA